MTEAEAIAFRVLERVSWHGPIQLEELGRLLPHCMWNQMFAAVDRLSREGRLEVHHPERCTYVVALRTSGGRSGVSPDRNSLPS
jgi:hypothetical protein